ncbi:hypothetical protein FSP39_014759 [Pinctada imbricata]|uniref:Uncharacterized protein n=1 Tax=Pinctada imbricata TaxID=66713 RepID=A0AA89BMD1_PINIB|nr:hypothetical protein FSP39_014759 [Pinctada imbricata]
MSLYTGSYIDNEMVDQCDQIRAIASKNWLSSAHVSLRHLDQVKATVYNVGLQDARDLKATNIPTSGRTGRSRSFTDLTADPPLSAVSLQRNTAWGSNGSIPDMVSLQSARSQLSEVGRPHGAKRSRPASAKQTRPSSAKESQLPPKPPSIGVKGARFDPSGRPPKHTSHHTGTGWVGPPAGMKYPDQDTSDVSSLRYVNASPHPASYDATPLVPCGTPVPPSAPCASPVPLDEQELPANIYREPQQHVESISVHVPQADAHTEEDDTVRLSLTHNTSVGISHHSSVPTPKPTPEPIHLSLPTMEDDVNSDSDLDTERLIAKANEHTSSSASKHQNFPKTENLMGEHTNSDKHKDKSKSRLQQTSTSISLDKLSVTNQEGTYSYLEEDFECNSQYDWSEDEEDLPEDFLKTAHLQNYQQPVEKHTVKFSEDKNVTIDITPRNQGHRVSQLDNTSKNGDSDLKLALSFTSMAQLYPNKQCLKSVEDHGAKRLIDSEHKTQGTVSSQHPKVLPEKESASVPNERCERRLSSPERPKSALKTSNRPSTPVTTVTVSYGDTEDVTEVKKTRRKKKMKEKDIITMVQQTSLSDSEGETKDKQTDGITPDKLEAWMPTKCVSEPIKNYYEISRHSGAMPVPIKMEIPEPASQVYKTTKTLEFDELKPKETSIRSVIDNNQLLNTQNKERQRFVGLPESSISQLRNMSRPSSASYTQRHPQNSNIKRPASAKVSRVTSDRPGSRQGFVAMAPENPNQSANKMLRRPLSAGKPSRPVSASAIGSNARVKENIKPQPEPATMDSKSSVLEETDRFFNDLEKKREKERERQIEELINKHLKKKESIPSVDTVKTVIGESMEEDLLVNSWKSHETKTDVNDFVSQNTEQHTAETSDQPLETAIKDTPIQSPCVKPPETKVQPAKTYSSMTKAPVKNVEKKVSDVVLKLAEDKVHKKLTENHRHYASYSRGRVKSAPVRRTTETKIRYTKPTFINSRNPENDVITDVDIETHLMSEKLKADGINVKPETLERALYPPSGRTTYYEINATLPKSTSQNLLSHPRVWLPVEYKQLKLAEKNLAKANEIMHRQKLAEERRARLAETGTAAKKKKKGKKKGTLRRSKSIC